MNLYTDTLARTKRVKQQRAHMLKITVLYYYCINIKKLKTLLCTCHRPPEEGGEGGIGKLWVLGKGLVQLPDTYRGIKSSKSSTLSPVPGALKL